MGRKARIDRSPEEKWQIVQEAIKRKRLETCRRHGILQSVYRWKDQAEQGGKAASGGRSAAAAETERTIAPQLNGHWDATRRLRSKRRGGVSCGEVHSQAREMERRATQLRWLQRR